MENLRAFRLPACREWLRPLGFIATLLNFAAGAEAQAAPAPAPPAWQACADEPRVQCATYQVPLDYNNPGGPTIGIALAKLPAADPAQRIGTLFVNPGGPGESGKQFVFGVAATPDFVFNADVRKAFDIVGFDPRFVGESGAVACNTGEEYQALFANVAVAPSSEELVASVATAYTEFGRQCAANAPQLEFAGTGYVARDLDLLRQAVGDAQLNYAGYSYGTLIGQVYAALFPNNVRALILDGVLDAESYSGSAADSGIPLRIRTQSAEAAYTTFEELLRLCREAGAQKCPLAADGDPETKVNALAEAAWNRVPSEDYPGDYYSDFVLRVAGHLYKVGDWFQLAATLQSEYTLLVGGGNTPVDNGETPPLSNGILTADIDPESATRAQWLAVTCADAPNPVAVDTWRSFAVQQEEVTPNFGYLWVYKDFGCAFWPFGAKSAYRGPFSTLGSGPVLVINSRFDPSTNYNAAVAVASRFPNAQLLTYEGWGHVASQQPTSCVRNATASYLINLTLPADASCQPESIPFQ